MVNILSSHPYDYLKRYLLKSEHFDNIDIESKTFPDGEHYYRIIHPEKISGKSAVYICGTTDDVAILEAYNVACTLVQEGCQSLHLVIPYFGYSTMERAVNSGESVSAKNIARLFSSIPISAIGNYIYLVDLHSFGVQYYFEQNIHPMHLTTDPIIDKMINDIRKNKKNVVLASADMGRAKWIEKISGRLNMNSAFIMKKRVSGVETEVLALNANVKNKDVILFDDMIRSGSSIIHAAEAYKSIGAKNIYVVCVHGVFVDDSIEKIKESGVIKAVYCTNTHPKAQNIQDDFVKVYDMSDVILEGLKV